MDWLTVSVALFLAHGLLWILIGVGAASGLPDTRAGRTTLIFSGATDTKTFGMAPAALLATNLPLATLRTTLLRIVGGLLAAGGILICAVAWFGLRGGEGWAWATLAFVGLLVLPFWRRAYAPYRAAGTRARLLDLPPFMWIPAALWLPATLAGWLALG